MQAVADPFEHGHILHEIFEEMYQSDRNISKGGDKRSQQQTLRLRSWASIYG
jgi:ATP-dependent helicase/DNAse subunit B